MRCRSAIFAASFALLWACSSDDDDDSRRRNTDGGISGSGGNAGSGGSGGSGNPDGSAGNSGSGGALDGGNESDGGTLEACLDLGAPDGGDAGDAGAADAGDGGSAFAVPKRVVVGSGVPLGVTSGGTLIFRDMARVQAVDLVAGGTPFEIANAGGTTAVRGPVALHWSNIDYERGTATLTMWTGARCLRSVANSLSADDAVAVSPSGSHLLYANNITDTTFDVVLASRDFTTQQVVASRVGRASDTTCRARYGFAGPNVVLATCASGSLEAKLKVWRLESGTWTEKTISDGSNGGWVADATGQRIVYTDNRSNAYYWGGGDGPGTVVDDGVGWIRLNPTGNVLLYGAGSQMRRTALPPDPDQLPLVIVSRNFRNIAAWSPNDQYALYSSAVTYEGGEKRDLLLARTAVENRTLTRLVNTVTARLSRSAFTEDSRYALYLTDVNAQGAGTLTVRPLAGGTDVTHPHVDTVLAVRDSLVLFSANRSETAVPVVAELKLLDAAGVAAPTTLQSSIVDGRNFYLTPDRSAVVYARPPQTGNAAIEGIWVQPVE